MIGNEQHIIHLAWVCVAHASSIMLGRPERCQHDVLHQFLVKYSGGRTALLEKSDHGLGGSHQWDKSGKAEKIFCTESVLLEEATGFCQVHAGITWLTKFPM